MPGNVTHLSNRSMAPRLLTGPPGGCTNLNVSHAQPLYVPKHESHSHVCDFLVSPTGFEGLCHDALPSWGIPYQGTVEAA